MTAFAPTPFPSRAAARKYFYATARGGFQRYSFKGLVRRFWTNGQTSQ